MIRNNYVDRQYLNFDNLDEFPKQIFDILVKQEDLFRLLKYTEDPLSPSNPNLTIKEKKAMIFTRPQQEGARIFFLAWSDNVEDEEHSEIRIYIRNINVIQDHVAEVMFGIDIISHNNLVSISDYGNRLLRMLNIIVKALNGYTGTISVGQLQIPTGGNIPLTYFNKSYQGYMLPIKARINNVTTCQSV